MAEAQQQQQQQQAPAPQAAKEVTKTPAKFKYEVVEGKHCTGKNKATGELMFAKAGETVIMTEAEAKRWPGKFKRVAEPVAVEEKAKPAQ